MFRDKIGGQQVLHYLALYIVWYNLAMRSLILVLLGLAILLVVSGQSVRQTAEDPIEGTVSPAGTPLRAGSSTAADIPTDAPRGKLLVSDTSDPNSTDPVSTDANAAKGPHDGKTSGQGGTSTEVAAENLLLNGDFEAPNWETTGPPNWYYNRLGRIEEDGDSERKQVLTFANHVPGRDAQIQQRIFLAKSETREFSVQGWIKARDIDPGQMSGQLPGIVIMVFDKDQRQISEVLIGTVWGDQDWTLVQEEVLLPRGAKNMIVGIGLMGATGQVWFDDLRVVPLSGNRSIFPRGD